MSRSEWEQGRVINCRVQDNTRTYLSKALENVFESLRCIYYFQAIYPMTNKSKNDSILAFTTINNALFQISVISWCKLFGSKKEDTYYLKIFNEDPMSNDFGDAFEKIQIRSEDDLWLMLLEKLNKSPDEFNGYVDKMKHFRDKHFTHTDLDIHYFSRTDFEKKKQNELRQNNLPEFSVALESLFWFYGLITDLLSEVISEDVGYPFMIKTREHVEELIQKEISNFKSHYPQISV